MKKTIAFMAIILSLGAFAQESVVLNSENVFVDADEALLVRTAETPDTVKVNFQVAMKENVCQRTEYRTVTRTCYRTMYRTGRNYGGRCLSYNRGRCVNYAPSYNTSYTQAYPCTTTESYCASYALETSYRTDAVKIKFKNLPALGGSEEETFLVRAQQKRTDSGNVIYDIIPKETLGSYVVKDRGFLGSDKFVIQPK